MINIFYHIGLPPLNVTIFITLECNCVMGASPMVIGLLLLHIVSLIPTMISYKFADLKTHSEW